MSAKWVTVIAPMGTFVVNAASAIAALVQLRHVGASIKLLRLESREMPALGGLVF